MTTTLTAPSNDSVGKQSDTGHVGFTYPEQDGQVQKSSAFVTGHVGFTYPEQDRQVQQSSAFVPMYRLIQKQ